MSPLSVYNKFITSGTSIFNEATFQEIFIYDGRSISWNFLKSVIFRADYISGFLRIFAYLKNENGYQKAYNNDISDFLWVFLSN